MAQRGRPKGTGKPTGPRIGSVRGWLTNAPIGSVMWTEQDTRQVTSTANRVGVTLKTERCYAIHPGTERLYKLARIEIISRA